MNSRQSQDPRVVQTRGAIINSFNQLVFNRPYEAIKVPAILDEAGVGRSTFYEHFKNKDELLKQAAAHILGVLADSVVAAGNPAALTLACHHFRDRRETVRDLLAPPACETLTRLLAELIELRLDTLTRSRAVTLPVPPRMIAAQIAAGQIAIVREWLESLAPVTPEHLARTIRATSQGTLAPLLAMAQPAN